ncbi:hypothetical protein DSL92_05885 [Billgrantia gudaonensis]|uniref:Uncharacterized protein n=1 Tax=Billgrantia gudaonensis TaxID=376427 RepID=A0A432JJH4_9GAMM|nr:hypothetical protein DSL92_05885 [Halomonas gudaonensis]
MILISQVLMGLYPWCFTVVRVLSQSSRPSRVLELSSPAPWLAWWGVCHQDGRSSSGCRYRHCADGFDHIEVRSL